MDAKELLFTVIFTGLLAIFGLMAYSNVTNSVDNVFVRDSTTVINETHTPSSGIVQLNHGALEDEQVVSLDAVHNGSATLTIIIGTEINVSGTGVVTGNANLSDTPWNFSYTYESDTDAINTKQVLDDDVLDAYEIGVIAIIVLAAVTILGILYMIGR